MSINELESKCRELRQLQALIDEAQAEAEALYARLFGVGELPALDPETDYMCPSITQTEDGFDLGLGDIGDREFGFSVTAFAQQDDGSWVLEGQVYDGSSEGIETVYTSARAVMAPNAEDILVPYRLMSLTVA